MFISFNDENLRLRIDAVCRGYSSRKHWTFFQQMLQNPNVRHICILGVYYGRDIAYMDQILKQLGRTDCTIVGVDKFADAYCEDWPEAIRGKNWNEAGFGPAPSRAAALANLEALGVSGNVTLIQSTGEEYLAQNSSIFDFIYIDTSHDYETALRSIDLGIPRLHAAGFMGGDDYSNEGTWGVKKAVTERFPNHQIAEGWIWLARRADYRPAQP